MNLKNFSISNLKIFSISIMFFLTLIFSKVYDVYGFDEKNLFKSSEINLYNQNPEKNIYQKSSEFQTNYVYFSFKEKVLNVADEKLKFAVKENYIPIFFDKSKTDEEIVKFLREISEDTLIKIMNETYDNRNLNILDFFINFKIDDYFEDFKKTILDVFDDKMIIFFRKNFISRIIFSESMTDKQIMKFLRSKQGIKFFLFLIVGEILEVYRNQKGAKEA
ncbi:MAG: hypothetical protein Q8889_02350 [Candidatus Phytoplasma australasiaticum]|nr:hypothetical protein [Candidatus Phytoplasma australasiaticum]MDV3199943.1 hypothetical protein [Candidatus Phytoplasma australasiaticum]